MANSTCIATDCTKGGTYAIGYCSTHYTRLKKWGSLDRPPARDCLYCKISFTPEKSNGRNLCSAQCRSRFYGADSPAKLCNEADCERPLRARGLCSMHWKRDRRAAGLVKNEPWDERRRAHYQKRRAQKLNLPADNIRPADVYERAEWVCGICLTPVDRKTSYPDPMSPSLDHVLPLSLGGHHTMDNVTLAHLSCNVRKGNRVEVDAMSA